MSTPMSPSRRPLSRSFFSSLIVAVAAYGVYLLVRENRPEGDLWRGLTAAAAFVAVVGLLVVGRRSAAFDEFERQVQGAALAFAFPVSLLALFTIGLLAGEGALTRFELRDAPAVLLVAYVAGLVLAWRRYR